MGFVVAVLTAVLLLNQSIKIRKKEQKSFDFYSFFQSFSEKYSFSVASLSEGGFFMSINCLSFLQTGYKNPKKLLPSLLILAVYYLPMVGIILPGE